MNKAMLTNHEYKDEMRRVMKIPIQSFVRIYLFYYKYIIIVYIEKLLNLYIIAKKI